MNKIWASLILGYGYHRAGSGTETSALAKSPIQVIWEGRISRVWGRPDPRDVKNEDRSGHVYENKGDDDKMSIAIQGFYTKMHRIVCTKTEMNDK